MTTSTKPSIKVIGDRIEGLEEYTEAVRAEAHATGVREGREAAYTEGRADASAIFGSEAARGREALAAELASDPSIKPERALSILGKAAAAPAATTSFKALVQGTVPDVGPAAAPERDNASQRRAELTDLTKRIAQARR